MDRSNYTTVAALDLGNTNSGYAFSLKSEFKIDPLKIHVNRVWNAGGRQLLTLKTPTCVLLNKNKELKTFGYDAENEFADICMDGDQNDYYFFRGFFDKKNFTMDAMLIDTTGKNLPANLIFTVFIKAFVNHLTECLDQTNSDLKKGEIRWVIPVSVSLNDTDKQFLRSCTEQAGINSHQLILVTKAEAEFIYCQQLPDRDHYQQLKDGIEYMFVHLGEIVGDSMTFFRGYLPCRCVFVTHKPLIASQLDDFRALVSLLRKCQGARADITVLKKVDNQVVETYRITGNECGGISVDDRFLSLFFKIFGSPCMKSLRQEDPIAFLDIVREISCIKSFVKEYSYGKTNMTIPYVSLEMFCQRDNENLPEKIASSPYAGVISLRGDKMRIDSNIIHNLFKPSIDKIMNLIEQVFTDYKGAPKVKGIVMVGAFSCCRLIQDTLKKTFSYKNINIPEDPEVAVMKGAVLCGHQPYQYIRSSSSEEMSASILTKLSELNRNDFKDLVASGTFATYDNKVYLAGPCNIGKSSLASILIGEPIPKTWFSTDGLIIHFGRNGIDLKLRKMIPLRQSKGDVFTKLILGNPKVKEHQRQSLSSVLVNENRNQVQDVPFKDVTQHQNKETKQTTVYGYQQKQQRQPTSKSSQIPVTRTDMPHTHDRMRFKVEQKLPIYSARSIQNDVMETIKKRSYNMNIAPSDLVDFGGQKSFDMTHQLFIQHKGTFILMFDGRHGLHTKLTEYTQGHVTAASILEHWINSVLTYCNKSEDKMPRIVFAATHSDKFSKNQQEKLALKFQEELTTIFSSHKLHEHIMYSKVFFINATDVNDLNIDLLKDELVDIAFHQSTWGQRMPVVWVPLDLLISDLREDGRNLITKESLWEMNRSNDELALSNRRFEDFLIVQHSIGKILYFDEPALRDFIVIQPTSMVNILRAFITDRYFWPKEGPIRDILENLSCTGVIQKTELFALWSQPAFKDILTDDKTKEYIVQVLLHLDILVEPKRYSGKTEASDLFLVPCIVRETIPAEIQQNATGDRTICIAYHLKNTIVPSAFSFKVIGATISNWPLKAIDSRYCLYFQSAVMDAGNNNELQIHVKGQRIVVYLINEVSKQLISPDLATTTQECLTLALGRILQFYRRSSGQDCQVSSDDLFEIEVGEICKRGPCFLHLSDAIKHPCWRCINEKTHETKCLLNWVFDKNKEQCDQTCKGLKKETLLLTPNDQHFVQLARKIGIADFYNFFIFLGMTKSDYENLNFRYFSNPMDFMLMGLFEWRDKIESRQSAATLKNLLEALTAIERQHYLCQVHREDHSLLEKAHRRLQDVPSDHVIRSLIDGQMIGDCVVHLGVELGLSIRNIKETMYNFPRDLNGQISDLLFKWKTFGKSNKSKPTIYRLMVALQRVTAAEGLVFLKKTYGVE